MSLTLEESSLFTPFRSKLPEATATLLVWTSNGVHQFCKKLNLKRRLQTYVKFHQRSSLYHPVELILAMIYALIAGIHRLKKTKILQGNGAFQRIVGLKNYPYSSSLRRFLRYSKV